MKISDYLIEECILLNLKASDKNQAIHELTALLGKTPFITDADLFIKDVFTRESFCTTGMNSNIALPHARSDTSKSLAIAFGRSTDGIDFDSPDKSPAKLIFLFGTPKERSLNLYIKILAKLSRLLRNEGFRNKLQKASTATEIIEEFCKIDALNTISPNKAE